MSISAAMPTRRRLLLAAPLLALAGCGSAESGPFLAYAGGGFIFNYRTANHYYGLVMRQRRPLPEGGRIEVRFEVPGGEEVQSEPVTAGRLQYKFQTGDLDGIVPGHGYTASVRLLDPAGKELERFDKRFTTTVDQSTLPDKPLVTGPGYQPAN